MEQKTSKVDFYGIEICPPPTEAHFQISCTVFILGGATPPCQISKRSRASCSFQTISDLWDFIQLLLGKRAQEGLNQNQSRGSVRRQESTQTGG